MAEVKRPWNITLLEVLGVVSGVFGVLVGLTIILDRNDPSLMEATMQTASQLAWIGGVTVAIGVLKILLSMALGRGSEFVRILFAIVASINLGAGVYGIVTLDGEQQAAATLTAVIAAVVLYLLFNARAQEYFDSVDSSR